MGGVEVGLLGSLVGKCGLSPGVVFLEARAWVWAGKRDLGPYVGQTGVELKGPGRIRNGLQHLAARAYEVDAKALRAFAHFLAT